MSTTRNTDEVIELLRGHWIQGAWLSDEDGKPAYCVVGAACQAFHDQAEWFDDVSLPEGRDVTDFFAYDDEDDLAADMKWFAGLADFLANHFREHGLVADGDRVLQGGIEQFWHNVEQWEDQQRDPLPVIYQWNDALAQSEDEVISMLTDYESWRQERKHVADVHADARLYGYE